MKHTEKRANLFYAVLTVPHDVRHIVGKLRYIQSTRTGNRSEAALRAANLVAGWKLEIEAARGTLTDPRDTFWHDIRREHAKALQADEADEGEEGGTLAIEVQDVIRAAAGKITDPEEASFMYRTAIGRLPALPPLPPLPTPPKTTSLAPLVVAWKASLRMAQKTIDQQHRDIVKMAEHFQTLEALTPQKIKAWTDGLMARGTTASSFERLGNGCRSFWLYLQQSGTVTMIEPDPFVGPFRLAQRTAVSNKVEREAFTPDDLAKVYTAAVDQGDQPLADLIALGAYTGGRIEELCNLTKETAKDGFFHMGTKTEASLRDCPIHPAVVPLVARMLEASKDGYLVPSTADNQYATRSKPLSQRFGRLKKALGFGPKHVFHSTRHTLVTLMHQAGVRPEVIADVAGHEKGNFTLDTYGSGSSMAQKLKAISKVAYPAPLNRP